EARAEDRGVGAAPSSSAAPAPEEDLRDRAVLLLVARLALGEQNELAKNLVLTMNGKDRAELVKNLRRLAPRLDDQPRPVLDALEQCIRGVACSDPPERFGNVYNIFITAQLPGFVNQLHLLRPLVPYPHVMEILQDAWKRWPLIPPPEIPEGASELD